MKGLRLFFTVVFSLIAAICLVLLYFVSTERGAYTVIEIIKYCIPGQLSVESVNGRLIDSLQLKGVHYTNPDYEIEVNADSIIWNWDLKTLVSLNTAVASVPIHLTVANITVNYPLFKPHYQLNTGELQVNGQFSDYNFQLTGLLSGDEISKSQVVLTGTGELAELKKIHLKIKGLYHAFPLTGNLDYEANQTTARLQSEIQTGNARLQINAALDETWKADWVLTIPQVSQLMTGIQGKLQSTGTITGLKETPDIKSKVQFSNLRLENGNLFSLPNLTNINGVLESDLVVKNLLSQPALTGTVSLSNGTVFVVPLGITLKPVTLQAHFVEKGMLAWQGEARSGKGSLQLAGKTDLNSSPLSTEMSIQGTLFEIIHNRQYEASISPDLTFKQMGERLDINGIISVPAANIHPINFTSAISMPAETVIIEETQTTTQNLPELYATIQVLIGDNVTVDIVGLIGRLTGDLTLSSSPKTDTTAKGGLQIHDGQLTLFGKKLKVSEGQLLFTGGDVSNPNLNIQASKSITTLTQSNYSQDNALKVGVSVKGNADDPDITLFSDPSGLSQPDILSYILLDKPMNQVGAADSVILVQALAALKTGNASTDSLTESVQKAFGLDELSFGQVSDYDQSTRLQPAAQGFR
ncbi:MAG: tamB [Gammaproteobacteria bacterium]|nr:tamB [Gammaproteobacteria bacterium]